jgi:hypothetical protein
MGDYITVEMEEGSVSHVELKVNATLGDDQVEQQRSFVETSRDEIIYILLGTQQFMTPAQMHLEHWEGAGEQEISFSADGVITLGPKERFYVTSPKRLNLDDLINALSEAAADIDQPEIQELATAYRSCWENIRQTFTSFVSRIGVPHFTSESHPLLLRRIAVDDFIEYYVHLDARRGEFRFKMSVIGDDDADDATYVRKRFRDLL